RLLALARGNASAFVGKDCSTGAPFGFDSEPESGRRKNSKKGLGIPVVTPSVTRSPQDTLDQRNKYSFESV
ncbi:hypothetical protein, partial [Caballeronia sp. LZ028]|uniref:hypothetical protein n=1 Tax=Caballeronia sp. LZ028 TaxID=3038563 RepID=UPI00285B26EC